LQGGERGTDPPIHVGGYRGRGSDKKTGPINQGMVEGPGEFRIRYNSRITEKIGPDRVPRNTTEISFIQRTIHTSPKEVLKKCLLT
jgi:hypothetical protein